MARVSILTLAAGLLLAQSGAAQSWVAAPTAADMAAVYPEKAKAAGIGGGVDLACTVARSGALDDCQVLGETPRGYGFGAAARKLAGKLQGAGLAKGAELRVPITFAPELTTSAPVVVKTPRWTATPTAAEMQALVPKQTDGPNEVRVTLVCGVQAGGVLGDCVVDRELPAGQGFGAAVLALAPKFKADLMSVEGQPTVGAKVRLPVRFSLKPVEQAAK